MGTLSVYGRYHDEYVDRGDPGGDSAEVMTKLHNLLDEHGLYVRRDTGIVFEMKDPVPELKDPEHVILGEVEVTKYDSEGREIGKVMRTVPVRREKDVLMLPNEKPASDSPFDRALAKANLTFNSSTPKFIQGEKCPFRGSAASLWYQLHGAARKRGIDLDLNLVDNTIRLLLKAVPELSGYYPPMVERIASRVRKSKHPAQELEAIRDEWQDAAEALHKLQEEPGMFKPGGVVEEQIDAVAASFGITTDELIRRGCWVTNRGRYIPASAGADGLDPEDGELFADRVGIDGLEDHIAEKEAKDRFDNKPVLGMNNPQWTKIFDRSWLHQKPLEPDHVVMVSGYTVYFWPQGEEPTDQNVQIHTFAGFWEDLDRKILKSFPEEPHDRVVSVTKFRDRTDRNRLKEVVRTEPHPGWQRMIRKDEGKIPVTRDIPMTRRPSWHYGCVDCESVFYRLPSGAAMADFATIAATPDDWPVPGGGNMARLKVELEEMVGMPVRDFVESNVQAEKCPKCSGFLNFVTPMREITTQRGKLDIPRMTVCSDHAWWQPPMVMDDWGANLRFYSRRDAQDRLNTILTDEGLKYAEQISDNTTLVMEMDWLMWPGQLQVRKLRDEIDTADLLGAEYQLLRDRAMQFGPRQRRFLLSYLFEKRCQANRAVVAGSKWIQALKGKLGRVTGSTFHDVYATVVKILTSEDADDRLTVPEKMFAWSLLKHLKNELRRDAEAWRIKHGGGKFSVALASIGGLSFRHLRAMNAKIGALSLAPEAMFLLREAAKSKYKELKLRARTTSFIQESEAYLLDVLDGAVDADPDRIEDLRVAAGMAHSAAHLGELIDRLTSQEQLV